MAPASKTQRRVLWAAAVAALVSFIGVLAFVAFAERKVGHTVLAQKDALTITLDAYSSLIDLMTLTFGAVAFLVTYQLKKSATLRPRAWAALAGGLILFLGALVQGLLGREVLLRMVAENLVVLDLPGLTIGRVVMYAFTVAGAGLIGWFALDVALAETKDKDGDP